MQAALTSHKIWDRNPLDAQRASDSHEIAPRAMMASAYEQETNQTGPKP